MSKSKSSNVSPELNRSGSTEETAFPEFTASGRPTGKVEHFAFQLWMILFLGLIAFTLIQYIVSWIV